MKEGLVRFFAMRPIKYVAFLVMLTFITAILVPTENFFAHFLLDYTLYGVLTFLVLSIFFLFINQRWLMYGAIFTTVTVSIYIHLLTNQITPLPLSQTENTEEDLNISMLDLQEYDQNIDSLTSYILNSGNEIIALQGLSDPLKTHLKTKLSNNFIYQAFYNHGDKDNCGLAILSKYRFTDIDTFFIDNIASLKVAMQLSNGENLSIINVQSPENRLFKFEGSDFFQKLALRLNKLNNPYLCLGNFNLAPWNKTFLKFQNNSNLINSRNLNRIVNSSKAHYVDNFNSSPRIHILYSKDITCTSFFNFNLASKKGVFGAMGSYYLKPHENTATTDL